LHAVEPRGEVGGVRALGDEPRRRAVVHDGRGVLDVSLRREHEELRRRARGEGREVLRRDGVQPAQAVRTRDGHDAEVRLVDDGAARPQGALLARRVAVVPRDALVGARRGDGAVAGQERAGVTGGHGWSSFAGASGPGGPLPARALRRQAVGRRLSFADAYDCNGSPKAANSHTHRSWPSTYPYRRFDAVTSDA